jgi:hypothetical protein
MPEKDKGERQRANYSVAVLAQNTVSSRPGLDQGIQLPLLYLAAARFADGLV